MDITDDIMATLTKLHDPGCIIFVATGNLPGLISLESFKFDSQLFHRRDGPLI
jgi:hypothetical protein